MENPDLSAWVQSRIELLAAPADWEPDLRTALARQASRAEASRGERTRRGRVLLTGAGVALALFIVVTVLPRMAVLAQTAAGQWHPFEEAWNWVTVVWRGPVLLLANPGAALRVETVKRPGEPQPAANAAIAERDLSSATADCGKRGNGHSRELGGTAADTRSRRDGDGNLARNRGMVRTPSYTGAATGNHDAVGVRSSGVRDRRAGAAETAACTGRVPLGFVRKDDERAGDSIWLSTPAAHGV